MTQSMTMTPSYLEQEPQVAARFTRLKQRPVASHQPMQDSSVVLAPRRRASGRA